MFLDSVFAEKNSEMLLSLEEKNKNEEIKTTLFSRGRRTECFFTEDSKLYITPQEQKLIDQGVKIRTGLSGFDSLSSRVINNYLYFKPQKDSALYKNLVKRYAKIQENVSDIPKNISQRLSLGQLWNLSMVGAIVLGMVSMTFIYRYFGVGASALGDTQKISSDQQTEQVLGAEDIKNKDETVKYIQEMIQNVEETRKGEFEKELKKMVKGYPIEDMLPYIVEKDRMVAAFLVGIARKESGWGKHVPVLDGKDCYNYWGYRGIRKKMGTGGHTCFDSRKDAVDTVAKRLEYLIEEKKLNTPAKMSIWKCGSACDKDGQVHKWISDVDLYFSKIND